MEPENQLSKYEEQFTTIYEYDIKQEPAEEYEFELPEEDFEPPEDLEAHEDQYVEYEALEEYRIDSAVTEDSYELIPMDPKEGLPAFDASFKEQNRNGCGRSEDSQTGDKSDVEEVMLEDLPDDVTAEMKQEPNEWTSSNPDLIFCKSCGETFEETQGLVEHMRTLSNNCIICKTKFFCPLLLKEHKQNACFHRCSFEACNMRFMKKEDLKAHKLHAKHGKPKWPRCRLCPKSFLSQPFLDKHVRNKHPGFHESTTSLQNKCSFCSKEFVKLGMLFNHVRVCHKRSNTCAWCNHKFNDISLYIEHKKIHIAPESFKCLKCGHCFESNSLLLNHQGKCRKFLETQLCNSLKARLLKRQK